MSYIAKIKLGGIKCGGCFSRISQSIYLEDINHLDIDYSNKIATIAFEDDQSVIERIIYHIEMSGYQAELIYVEEE